jgi:hypothetical protein
MVKDVLYVPGLTKKSDFSFSLGGQGLRGHIPGWESVHSSQGLQDSQSDWSQEREVLWHRRMAHLHHGALNVLKEIVTGPSRVQHRAS